MAKFGTISSNNDLTDHIDLDVQKIKLPTSNPARIDGGNQNWSVLFDATTSQSGIFQFVMPYDYVSGLTAYAVFSCVSTQTGTNTVMFDFSFAAINPNVDSESIISATFDTANTMTHTLANNQTAQYPRAESLSLTNLDSASANYIILLKVARNISDTATGDISLYILNT